MSKYIYIYMLLNVLLLCSCARRVTQTSTTSTTQSDTAYRSEARMDSVYIESKDSVHIERADSIIIYDSVHVIEHADGTRDTYRYRDTYKSTARQADKAATSTLTARTDECTTDTLLSMMTTSSKATKETTKRMTLTSYIAITFIILSFVYILVLIHRKKGYF